MMKRDNRDSLDFGTMKISNLYWKMLFPTIIGMISTVVNVVIDGIFVGKGIGSDAIAAVNIVAPLCIFVAGISLMFGVGSSVVASIHLSKNNNKAANINITQSFGVASIVLIILSTIFVVASEPICILLGSTERLLPHAKDYIQYLAPSFIFMLIVQIGLFVIRLDGSPKYAMLCSTSSALINILLNYFFIFSLEWGVKGAAIATSIGNMAGGMLVLIYMLFYSKTLKFYRLKLNLKSLSLTIRNIGYQIRIGSSALISEVSVSVMMLTGNYVFMRILGEDGVAAFSVACYCYPISFMINTAVASSAQPIISYNFGLGNTKRVKDALKLMVCTGLVFGTFAAVTLTTFASEISTLFLESGTNAHSIVLNGLPLFAIGFVFFSFNFTLISYYQSVENSNLANIYSIMRGIILPVMAFLMLPNILDVPGIWLAVPFADIIMTIIILSVFYKYHLKEIK